MRNIILVLAVFVAITASGAETTDNAGYTSDNESIERVRMDAQWDAEQAEFDKPNK